ncbi:MAG: helix-turn-helix domain-containing protein [Oscillospiraceae bacterium]|nr:helix-turn-helix domain-containing protein [Oscillospiraceae bacterium]
MIDAAYRPLLRGMDAAQQRATAQTSCLRLTAAVKIKDFDTISIELSFLAASSPPLKKEYNLLRLLVINRGLVLTYEQMYKKLWDKMEFGDISNTIECQVRSLRRKPLKAIPNAIFLIRSVGHSFDIKQK